MKNNYLDINKKAYDKSVRFAEENMNKNSQSYRDVVENLEKHLVGNQVVLELGSGNGYILKLLSNKGHKVTGIEFSKERVKLVKKTAPEATVLSGEFLDYDFGVKKYNLIIALEFIHLFPPEQLKKIMEKISNLLNNEGLFVVSTTINKTSKEGYLKKLDGFVRYRKRFTKKELEELLEGYNFKILDFFKTERLSGEILMNYICKK